ncbi:MAG: tyrosine--tRNA ligase [Polyangiales bacterium]
MDLIEELKARKSFHQCSDEEGLRRALSSGKVVGYIGFDPTAASLHLGSLVQIVLLDRLRRAGHTPIALVGGGTGLIGDPSGKSSERAMLSNEALDGYLAGIRSQLERYLDGVTLVDNRAWLGSMGLIDFLRDVGKHFSVNAMVQRDSVKNRLEQREHGISYTEFSYMLLQAYDFLALHERHGCTLQMGGSDQWGNIVSGIDLVRRSRGAECFGLTVPLLTRADGGKFGKTEKGTVWLDPAMTSPYELYQFLVNSADADVEGYLLRLTFETLDTVREVMEAQAQDPGARAAQGLLADSLTRYVHGDEGLASAKRATAALFGEVDFEALSVSDQRSAFMGVPTSEIPRASLGTPDASLVAWLASTGLFKSKTEARTSVEKGAASVNKRPVTDVRRVLTGDDVLPSGFIVLRKGRKSYHALRVTD